MELVANRFYSTFDLYTEREFELAVHDFRQRIITNFDDVSCVEWIDTNAMIAFQSTQ